LRAVFRALVGLLRPCPAIIVRPLLQTGGCAGSALRLPFKDDVDGEN
jgi:hypothetical protein